MGRIPNSVAYWLTHPSASSLGPTARRPPRWRAVVLTLRGPAILVRGMDATTTPRFWMPEQVSVDFHRHIYVIAHRMKQPYGYDLARGCFWLLDRGNLQYYGLRIQTAFGFEPYRVVLGYDIEVGGYASFTDAYWGLIAIRNELAIQHRHVRYFGHPCTGECDPLDCDACDDDD